MATDFTFLRHLADAAANQTLPRFRNNASVANKLEDGFDPVTEADREAERAIRKHINQTHPDHGILGEEFGAENTDNQFVWVIDPIDGTRAFISGVPVWGTLVGLMEDGDAIAGLMSQPFTGELYMAADGEAVLEWSGNRRPLTASTTTSLDDAIMFTTTPKLFEGAELEGYERLESRVKLARYGCDCYAFSLLASGHADLVVEPGVLQPYDIVGLIPLIEAAGGVVTRWDGGPAETGGNVVAAATPALHEAALRQLNG